jgi:hypothetical protein
MFAMTRQIPCKQPSGLRTIAELSCRTKTNEELSMAYVRSELLNQAIARLANLAAEQQDRYAIEILADLCSEEEWVLIVASEPYQKWVETQSREISAAPATP